MPTEKKIQIVSKIKQRLENAESVVFVDFRGLDANQINQLRQVLNKENASFLIAKNTLIQKALPEKYQNLPQLQGPTALITAPEKDLEAVKKLVDFAEEWEKPEIKTGFFAKELLTAEQFRELAKIPSKEALLHQLAFNTQYPIYAFIMLNKNLISQLTFALNQLADQKEN